MSTQPFVNIAPANLETLPADVRLVDVRERHEFVGSLGHLPGAELVPLATLASASASWPLDAPILLICRSGVRSTQAALQLAAGGFRQLYNLTGGMNGVVATDVARR